MTKRVFSLLMALALCLSLLPAPALAEEAGNGATTDPVANDGKNTYTSLSAAFEGVPNGGTISLLETLPQEPIIYNYGNKMVTLSGLNYHCLESNSDGATLTVSAGTLTLTLMGDGSVPIIITNNGTGYAVSVTGGTLAFGGKATLTGGLQVTGNGVLEGGLKEGSVITKSISVESSSNYSYAADLLAPGYAFAKKDASTQLVNGYVDKLTEDVIVVAHPNHTFTTDASGNYVCACGYSCSTHQFVNGKCTVCGYECPHPSDKVNESSGTATCGICGAQMAVKVTNGGTTTYYAKHFDSRGSHPENTLQEVFNKAADGSTITLLADGLYASGWATGKNITLNLNGKNLIENNGIVAAEDEYTHTTGKLTVTGSGTSTTPEGSRFPCTFRVHSGCDLLFGENFSGNYGTIYVESGATVKLKGGTFKNITCNSSVTLGSLLADGYCFQQGETPLKSDQTITSIENVKVVQCNHASIANNGTCDYCGMTGIAAVLTKPDGDIVTYTIGSGNDIFTNWATNGGTLKLYRDLTYSGTLGTQNGTTEMVIDLNGHTISLPTEATGQEVTLNGGTLTIQDSSTDKTGKFAAKLQVYYTASLVVDGAYVNMIAVDGNNASVLLKPGAQFDNIDLGSSGLRLFNCIESGSCVSGADLTTVYAYNRHTTIDRIPGTVTQLTNQNVSISYGSSVPDSFLPTVMLNEGVEANLTYKWLYKDSGFYSDPSYAPVTAAGQPLDMICVIKANEWSGGNTWETAVTGYTLTVTKGQAAVTKAPVAIENLTYNGSAQALLSDGGTATGGTMQYSLEQNGTYSANIPTGKDAKEYTVWYKAVGDENHEDSEPQSIKVTIAPKEVTITGTEVQPSKVYDGTTAADIIKLGNLNGKESGDELTIFAGNANYSDKNVGTGKTVTFRGFMLGGKDNGNYVLKAQPTAVTADITKAAFTVSAAPTAKTLTYNGSAQALVNAGTTADGTMVYSTEQDGTYSETIPTGTNAGNYTVWYKVKGDGNHNDSAPASIPVTIAKAKVTVTAKDKSAYVGSTAPDLSKPELDKDYTVSGLFGQDKLPETPTLKYVNAAGEEITPDMTKTGEVLIRADGNQSDNYVIVYVAGKLTVSRRSSSSSSGSSTPSTPGKTEITTNPDGSIKITPPKNSGKVKVEIPVKDVTAGTVAIIVKADGTEEIVKDALPTKNGIELTVDGSVTVKIVDNAKKFADTKGHWAEDAIDFVSARGLVNGVSETNFAPNAPTTRAQLWTILARQADADLTGGSTWYEKAQEWAKASGISDGSDPNGNITRAQMVTMLWRAAGSPAVSGSSAFTDVPGDSYYAQAVAWAAEKGITTGVGAGKFDPNGTCTRAQIATFLYRTYVNR